MSINNIDNNGEIQEPVLPFESMASDAELIEIFESVKDKVIKSMKQITSIKKHDKLY